ncbi:hypothetical protein LEP1GSC186_3037 [Leptospira noguchii serovar Autumnalis str. ZUN142]|uniref:Uncharacterized protein n=1 Tax=Leptospira noguchii serovar Autumnalis str. ZUN142 TaxID=1085540 RepID=M6UV22_9LEPT|nr:hypothetical protein LEP1GSC186_3037 [Leptospira noguchii serovar Autumnalis str. ZUN142]
MLFLLCVKIRSEISKRDLSRILGFSTFLSISRFTQPKYVFRRFVSL